MNTDIAKAWCRSLQATEMATTEEVEACLPVWIHFEAKETVTQTATYLLLANARSVANKKDNLKL